jgi:hypothetical protein
VGLFEKSLQKQMRKLASPTLCGVEIPTRGRDEHEGLVLSAW